MLGSALIIGGVAWGGCLPRRAAPCRKPSLLGPAGCSAALQHHAEKRDVPRRLKGELWQGKPASQSPGAVFAPAERCSSAGQVVRALGCDSIRDCGRRKLQLPSTASATAPAAAAALHLLLHCILLLAGAAACPSARCGELTECCVGTATSAIKAAERRLLHAQQSTTPAAPRGWARMAAQPLCRAGTMAACPAWSTCSSAARSAHSAAPNSRRTCR